MQVLISGATSGIGLEMTRKLLRDGHQVAILARNTEKAEGLRDDVPNEVNLKIFTCDLANLSSVRNAAQEVLEELETIDLLINNAGGIFKENTLSQDGFEMHFAVNHLGHFLLTNLLLDKLMASKATVMNVSSEAHRIARLNLRKVMTWNGTKSIIAYANSKLMNILFSLALTERYAAKGLKAFSAHPGVVSSNFAQNYRGLIRFGYNLLSPLMIGSKKGAEHVLKPLMGEHQYPSGTYFKNGKASHPRILGKSKGLSEELWDISFSLVTQQMA